MKIPEKEYIVWMYNDGGYLPTEFDTLEEALLVSKFIDNWYLTKSIKHVSAWTNFTKDKQK